MFGCYRKGDANDQEIYVAAVSAILSEYPQSVIDYITDPRTGLPGRHTFMPNPAEVRKACEEHMAPARAAQESEYRVRRQIAERTAFAGPLYRSERVAEGFKKLKAVLSGYDEATG